MWKVALAKQAATRPLIIIGTNNVGSGICITNDYERKGYKIVAAFDNDPLKCGQSIGNQQTKIQHIDSINQVVKAVGAKVAILNVAGADVNTMTRLMVDAGISTILNYSPENPHVPNHVNVLDMASNKKKLNSILSFLDPLSIEPTPLLIPLARYKFGNYPPNNNNNNNNNINDLNESIVELHAHQNESLSVNQYLASNSGSRYHSDFVELELLGKGGYGSVYRVYNRIDECEYAVKKIPFKTGSNNLKEVRAMAKLSHPNIVRYYSSWLEQTKEITNTNNNNNNNINNNNYNNPYNNPYNDESSEKIQTTNLSSSSFSTLSAESGNTNSSKSQLSSAEPSFTVQSTNISSSSSSSSLSSYSHNDKAILYIQMELCSKLTLRDWMAIPDRYVDLQQCLDLLSQLLQGLKYIHNLGFIHRDITPSNLFIGTNESKEENNYNNNNNLVLKIGDMGLTARSSADHLDSQACAVEISEQLDSHTIGVGTYLYASPEQLTTTNYNSNTDMYSVGVIFFEMLQPFQSQMERVMTLTKLKAGLIATSFSILYSRECGFIQWLLCKDAAQRPSASQLLQQLSLS